MAAKAPVVLTKISNNFMYLSTLRMLSRLAIFVQLDFCLMINNHTSFVNKVVVYLSSGAG